MANVSPPLFDFLILLLCVLPVFKMYVSSAVSLFLFVMPLGLDDEEVKQRTAEFGPNELVEKKEVSREYSFCCFLLVQFISARRFQLKLLACCV